MTTSLGYSSQPGRSSRARRALEPGAALAQTLDIFPTARLDTEQSGEARLGSCFMSLSEAESQ